MSSEKRWVILFFFVGLLWFSILSSSIYYSISGIEVLVDKDIDLFYLTLPLLSFNLLYTSISVFIFCAYLITIDKVKSYQRRKIIESITNGSVTSGAAVGALRSSTYSNTVKTESMCTIIIPSKDEEKVIRKTIENCLLQTYQNIEVGVVCHNCNDRTFEEAQVQDARVKVFNLLTPQTGKGIALNFGIEKANGEFILILDGDGRLSHDFIINALPMFKDGIAAVQGTYVPSNRNYNLFTKLLSIEGDLWSTPYMTVRSFLQKKVFLGGTGFIIRKDILYRIGKFANHLVDDYELSIRLFRMNYKVLFAPLSIDYDEKPPSIDIILRQRARWSRGFINMLRRNTVSFHDFLGLIYWLNPIAALVGVIILLIYGYAAIHNLIFEYFPFSYSYVPLKIWFLLIGLTLVTQFMVLLKEYGRSGLNYAIYLVPYNIFSIYFFVTFFKAFFVKSWASTKTAHGFTNETDSGTISKFEGSVL